MLLVQTPLLISSLNYVHWSAKFFVNFCLFDVHPLLPPVLTWTFLVLAVTDLLNVFEVFLPQLLLYPNPSDPLNADAAALMMKDRKLYDQKVKGENLCMNSPSFSCLYFHCSHFIKKKCLLNNLNTFLNNGIDWLRE